MARGKKSNPRQDEFNDAVGADDDAQKLTQVDSPDDGGPDGSKTPWKTIAIVAASIAVVAALAALTWSTVLGGDEPEVDGASPVGVTSAADETNDIFSGVTVEGNFLGQMEAPIEMIEFASLACERCTTYRRDTLPQVIQDFVIAGKLRLDLELLIPEGERGVPLATHAANALSFDSRIWQFTDIYYRDRAANPEGEPTAEYLESIAAQLDLTYEPNFATVSADELVQRAEQRAEALATEWVIDREQLPQFLIGPLGGPFEVMTADPTDPEEFIAAINEVMTRYGVAP